MTTRVAINGFGRVGRQSLKALIERAPDIEIVAINEWCRSRSTRTCSSTIRRMGPTQARSTTRTIS